MRIPLIVDPDQNFLDSLQKDPKAKQIPPQVARTGKDAQLLLSNKEHQYLGIFINPNVENPSGLSVIRFAHQSRPATPLFMLHEGVELLTPDEQEKLGIKKAFAKPITYSQILEVVGPKVISFDAEATLDAAKKNQDKIGVEVTIDDASFIPIRAEDFLSGSKCFFDVYIRLSSGRYVKMLQAGDQFTTQRISSYLQKGVTSFYLRKEVQEAYLAYCNKLSTTLVKSNNTPVEIKVSQTLNHGEETMGFFKKQGLSESNLEYATNFLDNVETLAKQLDTGSSDLLGGFFSDLASYEHGVATSMIASLLIIPLKIAASQPVKIIGLGSLLHDIGLYKLDPSLRDEDESKMNPTQLQVYYTHPTVGSEALKNIRGINPVAIQAVAQHHERRNKKGFPNRLGAGAINRVAEIIGISDEFAKLIQKSQKDPKINPLQIMQTTVFEGFSNPVVEAFREVFPNKPQ